MYNSVKKARKLEIMQKKSEGNINQKGRRLFRLKKESKVTKGRIIRKIRNLFELENDEDSYYKLIWFCNFYNKNYIEYENRPVDKGKGNRGVPFPSPHRFLE